MKKALKIAVVGVGGIGSTFAFQFAVVGKHDVTVIARPESKRLRELQRDQAIVRVDGQRAHVEVRDQIDESAPYDLIVVTLKAHQLAAVLPALRRSSAKLIQFMFNTFEPEELKEWIGSDRCALGMPFIQAVVDKDGKIRSTIGAGGQKSIWITMKLLNYLMNLFYQQLCNRIWRSGYDVMHLSALLSKVSR